MLESSAPTPTSLQSQRHKREHKAEIIKLDWHRKNKLPSNWIMKKKFRILSLVEVATSSRDDKHASASDNKKTNVQQKMFLLLINIRRNVIN